MKHSSLWSLLTLSFLINSCSKNNVDYSAVPLDTTQTVETSKPNPFQVLLYWSVYKHYILKEQPLNRKHRSTT
jgi:hypothetical protein